MFVWELGTYILGTQFSKTAAVTANLQFLYTCKMNFFVNVLEETAAFISRAEKHALSSVLDKEAACLSRTLGYVQNYTLSHCR